jgi:hypothetical protein
MDIFLTILYIFIVIILIVLLIAIILGSLQHNKINKCISNLSKKFNCSVQQVQCLLEKLPRKLGQKICHQKSLAKKEKDVVDEGLRFCKINP